MYFEKTTCLFTTCLCVHFCCLLKIALQKQIQVFFVRRSSQPTVTLNWGRNLLHLHVVQRSKFGSFRKWLIFRRKTGDGLWSRWEIKHVIWVRLLGQLPKKSDGMIGMMNVFAASEDMIHTFQFWGSTGCSPNWVQKIAEIMTGTKQRQMRDFSKMPPKEFREPWHVLLWTFLSPHQRLG